MPSQTPAPLSTSALLHAAREGFASAAVAPAVREAALANLERWLTEPTFRSYQPQIVALAEAGQWATLLDSFYQVIPFGTGGRRGTVGIGPNRINPWTLGASVQGHAAFLRKRAGEGPLCVVIANDVRRFMDARGALSTAAMNPVMGLSSRDFAEIAAEVYAAAGITVYLPPAGQPMSTPELSFAIRFLQATGGLNVSASHNPPDDNGGKFYNAAGGQEIPPQDEEMAQEVEAVSHVDRMPLDRARAVGLIRELGPEVHQAYIAANLRCSRRPQARGAKVVFTALHGTGRRTVYALLQAAGFDVSLEPTQSAYDGAFPKVPFGVPNPEVPRTMDAAVAHAERVGAGLVFACDPDADRLGMMVREAQSDPSATDPARWRFFTGNEIAVLVAHAILSVPGPRTRPPIVMKTEVTSGQLSRVARYHGAAVVGHLLVGFKYIGDGIGQLEAKGAFAGVEGGLADFALGAEESHGVLVTTELRDKDAAGAALLLAELASEEATRGRTLINTLEDLWMRTGYVRNDLISTVMRGAAGRATIQELQRSLRERPLRTIGGLAVTAFYDRQDEAGVFGPLLSETDRASRDVLVWVLGEEGRVILRPSGTEPKNKVYVELAGQPVDDPSDLRAEISRVNRAARDLALDFAVQMLGLVGIHLPTWALAVSDLVAVEQKVHFANVFMPGLISRLEANAPEAELQRFIDQGLTGYGKDARGLVADGVRAYVEAHPRAAYTPQLLRTFSG